MGSTWSVRVPHPPVGLSATQLQSTVQSILDTVEQQMSTYRPNSNLSQFNQSRSTDWFPIPDDFALVVAEAQRVSEQTGGAFDVTVGPLVNLWGFGPTTGAATTGILPTDAQIEDALQHVGYRKLQVRTSRPALRKSDPLVYVDLSAIAKGHAADLVGDKLESLNIHDYLVAVGGEMRARGLSHLGRPWRVGLETPTPGTHRILHEVELKDASLSTSGDYRNYFDHDGKRYSHEIDPATGRPAANAPASVTIIHESGTYADAMATALMVLGPEKGMDLAKLLHLAVLFTIRKDDAFETRSTPEFQAAQLNIPKM